VHRKAGRTRCRSRPGRRQALAWGRSLQPARRLSYLFGEEVRMRCVIVGVLLLFGSGALAGWAAGREDPPKKLTDAEISKLLVGKWAVEEGAEKGPKIKGANHYKKDGTIEAEATIEAGGETLKVTLSGTWKVMDGLIIATVTKTSAPELIKEGHVSKDQVISIDDKMLRYKTERGKESTRKRVKE
jgi:hypothetical protein